MGRPHGPVVTAADRKMRDARAAYFTGQTDARSFHDAMGEFNRWDDEHFDSAAAGCTGMPDLEEYPELPLRPVS